MSQKGLAPIIIIFIVLIVLGIVGGVFYFSKQTEPQSISLKPSPSATANWKTYVSQAYNFSMKYPNDWQTYLVGDAPGDEPKKDGSKRYFGQIGSNKKISLEIIPADSSTVEKVFRSMLDLNDKTKVLSGKTIDGYDAQVEGHIINNNIVPITVVFQYEKYIYAFQTSDDAGVMLNQMLDTFQFGGQRTGYKTFTSPTLNFTVQYPARWNVLEQNLNEKGSFLAYKSVLFSQPQNDNGAIGNIEVYITRNDYKDHFPNYKENFTVSGIPAYRVSPPSGMNGSYEDIAFKKGDIYFVIERSDNPNEDASYNNFLNTFKFIK